MKTNRTRRRLKLQIGALAALAAFGLGMPAANAGLSYVNYNVNAPVWQNGAQTAAQTKAATYDHAHVRVTNVGSNYQTDVQICSAYGLDCSRNGKIRGLGDNSSASAFASYFAGTKGIVAIFYISTWNSVSVNIYGSWKSN